MIYVCSCGNYVAEPTIDASRATLPGYVELAGAVYCAAPIHAMGKPEMRRVEVEEVLSE